MTKKEAFKIRDEKRAKGINAVVVRVSGIYTAPFRGIRSYDYYDVRVKLS